MLSAELPMTDATPAFTPAREALLQRLTKYCTPAQTQKIRKDLAKPKYLNSTGHSLVQMCRISYVARNYKAETASTAQHAELPTAACQAEHARAKKRGTHDAFMVALVMPIHPPHFPYAIHFIASMVQHKQYRDDHFDNTGSPYEYFPILSSQLDRAAFHKSLSTAAAGTAHPPIAGQHLRPSHMWVRDSDIQDEVLSDVWKLSGGLPLYPIIIPLTAKPAGLHGPLAPATTKKLLGVYHAFRRNKHKYAITLDAEVEFTSPHPFTNALLQWSERKEVLAAPTATCPDGKVPTSHREVTEAACAAVNLPAQPYYYWWSTAPIYERDDFMDFFSSYRWERNHNFDHSSYLCYKIEKQGWKLVDTAKALSASGSSSTAGKTKCSWPEYWSRKTQDEFCQSSLWIWTPWSARDAQGVRLLRFHLDRSNHSNIPGTEGDD